MNLKYLVTTLLFYSILNVNAQTTLESSGSGIFLSSDGYIATNNHVIENGLDIFVDVFANGTKKTYKANIIKTDPVNDLAVIKITDLNFKKLSSLPYAFKMMGINVGEKVFVMGFPRPGIQGDNEVKVTDGIISSKTGYKNDNREYQISAPIQGGNSGGPLFDNAGNLIGITTSGSPNSQNVGWAVKITYLNNLLDLIPNFPSLPLKTTISKLPFTGKIKALSKFVVLIRVPKCDLKMPNELFYKINSSSNYKDLSTLFNKEGDNYRTNGSGSSTIQFYKWYFCGSNEFYVNCWLQNNKLILAMKSFKNGNCYSTLTDENYKLIKTGMAYSEVSNIMQGEGDKYRTDYNGGDNEIIFYKWYDCRNSDLYFEVWFMNGKVHLVRKSLL